MGHALIDVTSGRDVLLCFHFWLLNDFTCNVLHGLHVVRFLSAANCAMFYFDE